MGSKKYTEIARPISEYTQEKYNGFVEWANQQAPKQSNSITGFQTASGIPTSFNYNANPLIGANDGAREQRQQLAQNAQKNRVSEIKIKKTPIKQYTVKGGDWLSKIAQDNNVSVDDLVKWNNIDNPDKIRIGQTINLQKPNAGYNYRNIKELNKEEASYNNLQAVQNYKHSTNYVVVDKKSGTLVVYDRSNKPIYSTSDINWGKSGNDYNTVTLTDAAGNLISGAGNEATPAGMSIISGTAKYHGFPAFTRSRVDANGNIKKTQRKDKNGNIIEVDDDVASSFHWGNINSKDRTQSNGCVRIGGKTLERLSEYLTRGVPVYTLPEKDESRFILRHGKLSFTANSWYGKENLTTTDAKLAKGYNPKDGKVYYKNDKGQRVAYDKMPEGGYPSKEDWFDDYNINIDKTYSPIKIVNNMQGDNTKIVNANTYASTIVNNKEKLMKDTGLTSAEYNNLARLALGIAEQETRFNTTDSKWFKDHWLGKGAQKLDNKRRGVSASLGYTQIKLEDDIKYSNKTDKKLASLYEKYNINRKSINTAENSAMATLIRLAHIYKNEVKGKTFTGKDGAAVTEDEAVMYKWLGRNSELTNHTATPELNKYIRNVNKYADQFDVYAGIEN